MFSFFREWTKVRREAEREADGLISKYGQDAWSVIYGKSRDRTFDDGKRRFHYRVRRIVERRLGIPPHVDTGTRYLD
jgi:hypothetical protein